jgi:organic hydroperoxide reductase OsmC/OhrA
MSLGWRTAFSDRIDKKLYALENKIEGRLANSFQSIYNHAKQLCQQSNRINTNVAYLGY